MKTTKTIGSLLLAVSLAAFTSSVASAKSYDITLASPTMIGKTELKAGAYSVKVNGPNAIFTSEEDGKSFTETAKVETVSRKYDQTAIETTTKGDTDYLIAIELGGSKTKLEFK
jgi:hypothetical protein